MSTLEVNTITPQSGTTITIGGSGDTVTLGSGATQSGFGGVNTPIFMARLSANQSISNNTGTKVQFDSVQIDTNSCYDGTTNYRFTPNVAGKYYLASQILINSNSNTTMLEAWITIYKNGSPVMSQYTNYSSNPIRGQSHSGSVVVEANGTTDYFEVYGLSNGGGSPDFSAGGSDEYSFFTGFKLVE